MCVACTATFDVFHVSLFALRGFHPTHLMLLRTHKIHTLCFFQVHNSLCQKDINDSEFCTKGQHRFGKKVENQKQLKPELKRCLVLLRCVFHFF